eukprot:COSAG06_NODE_1988_length_7903_cov_163.633521_5_plen_223_part_00
MRRRPAYRSSRRPRSVAPPSARRRARDYLLVLLVLVLLVLVLVHPGWLLSWLLCAQAACPAAASVAPAATVAVVAAVAAHLRLSCYRGAVAVVAAVHHPNRSRRQPPMRVAGALRRRHPRVQVRQSRRWHTQTVPRQPAAAAARRPPHRPSPHQLSTRRRWRHFPLRHGNSRVVHRQPLVLSPPPLPVQSRRGPGQGWTRCGCVDRLPGLRSRGCEGSDLCR